MAETQTEPTMEDILSSIKKIIAEDTGKGLSTLRPKKFVPRDATTAGVEAAAAVNDDGEDILELTEAADAPVPEIEVAGREAEAFSLVSPDAESQSRSALEGLSALIVKPDVAGSDTLEGMVREMLRPMLKDWLDANLPEVVERVVAREVARISGRHL